MRLIDADALIAEYDRTHKGEAGKARKLMEDAPTVDAIPIEYILKQIIKLERSKGQSYHAICYRHLIEALAVRKEG